MTSELRRWASRATLATALLLLPSLGNAQTPSTTIDPRSEDVETRGLVALVNDAAALVGSKGEAAFTDFAAPGSRWRHGETYIFVLDPDGTMLVHPDSALQGRSQLALIDVNGRPIIRGLLGAATTSPGKTEGWYHYQWNLPGEILPRWKSSYVRLVAAPSGKRYVVGSGMYTDRMEPGFVVDMVTEAVGQIESHGKAAFPLFHDAAGRFIAKDAYVFVVDMNGTELVNPMFPNLEGRNLLALKDTRGKLLVREMLDVVNSGRSGWVDYMWPKPGESVSTKKSTYVSRAKMGGEWVLVGSGVYLADAPKEVPTIPRLTASQLMALVREGAALVEQRGEQAYAEFRTRDSKWFRDDTYFFVWTMDGVRAFHAASPEREGLDVSEMKDMRGRSIGGQFLEAARSPSGEGWVHYMYPEPGDIFPTWKSSFVKRVTFPSGQQYLIGSGIYNMQMDAAFIEDVVNRAASLVAQRGSDAFPQLRDKTGPFVFMDTYVFVDTPDGTELVNAAQPSYEGRNIIDLKDLKGKALARDYIAAAMKDGSAWVEYYWYKPGQNAPARKQAFVRKVQHGDDTYVVGSGLYVSDQSDTTAKRNTMTTATAAVHYRWSDIAPEALGSLVERRYFTGDHMTIARLDLKAAGGTRTHVHESEEVLCVLTGALKVTTEGETTVVRPGEAIEIHGGVPHRIEAVEDTSLLGVFSPIRQDWIDKTDTYFER